MRLGEQEKADILERLRFEREARDALAAGEDRPPTTPWWDSKLVLLVVGAVFTSLLVPYLQYTQASIEWKRQNAYSNAAYQLEQMRACLTEFRLLRGIRPA